MQDNRELEMFLRNLQQGLRKYGLEAFNESLENILDENVHLREGKINVVLEVVCAEYDLTRKELLTGRGKGRVQQARKYTYCILYNDYNLPMRYIANRVFKLKWHTSVALALAYHKSLNNNLKMDKEFSEELQRLRELIKTKENGK